jgi:hypothetical protein
MVLLYLLIEDLIKERATDKIFFGSWEADYKAFFGNKHTFEQDVMLLRKTATNLVLAAVHSALQTSIQAIKKLVRKQSQRPMPLADCERPQSAEDP